MEQALLPDPVQQHSPAIQRHDVRLLQRQRPRTQRVRPLARRDHRPHQPADARADDLVDDDARLLQRAPRSDVRQPLDTAAAQNQDDPLHAASIC